MDFASFSKSALPYLDQEILNQINKVNKPHTIELHEMLLYHLGWDDGKKNKGTAGKKIRPLMLLMVNDACGGNWKKALPAAAGIELLHNFSLIHDDIEDNSETRRGRDSLWKKWGIAQGINSGDTLFSIANAALLDLRGNYTNKQVLAVFKTYLKACKKITQGQYLDISFETRAQIKIDQYWAMINGKTAALLSASCKIGALLGNASKKQQKAMAAFGKNLGLAFQVKDDLLGIWGDGTRIGKSCSSDLISGKKSLPIIYGLEQKGAFYDRYQQLASSFSRQENFEELMDLLTNSGAKAFAEAETMLLTSKALKSLEQTLPGTGSTALRNLAQRLLNRDS